ncbi:unnamed protein product [Knipowitschia caucasica]
MTISQRASPARSSIRAPKFLDKSSGFYGRLDEVELTAALDLKPKPSHAAAAEDGEVFTEDDGQMLLRRKASRRSSRWRSLRRKDDKEEKSPGAGEDIQVVLQAQLQTEPSLVHFPVPEEADDRVLIRDTAQQEQQEDQEEWRHRREQQDGIKALKRKSGKHYGKALDRAFRRGWEAFITNLYSVTLTPSSPTPEKRQPNSSNIVIAEMH